MPPTGERDSQEDCTPGLRHRTPREDAARGCIKVFRVLQALYGGPLPSVTATAPRAGPRAGAPPHPVHITSLKARGPNPVKGLFLEVPVCIILNGFPPLLPQDHVPDREQERFRIESMNPNPKMPLVRYQGGTWRVGGLLALSRAFGDAYLKVRGVARYGRRVWFDAGVETKKLIA